MLKRGRQRLQRVRAGCGDAGLVVALALALLAAPAVSALRTDCDSCPPDCPMHQHLGGAQNGPSGHLGCHHATSTGAPGMPIGKSVVGCASCGNHSLLPATALPPMLLAAGHTLSMGDAARARRIPKDALHGLGGGPPDTPPPIAPTSAA